MKIEYKDFVGIYDNSIPIKICEDFVENYETSEQNVELGDFLFLNYLVPIDSIVMSL